MKTATENGFEAAGIYPFDPVDYTKCVKNTIEKLHQQKEDPLIQDQDLMNRFFTMLNDVKLPLADRGIDIAPIKKEIQNYFSSNKLNVTDTYLETNDLSTNLCDPIKQKDLSLTLEEECSNVHDPEDFSSFDEIPNIHDPEQEDFFNFDEIPNMNYPEQEDISFMKTNSETQENDSTTIPSTAFAELVLPGGSILNVPIIDVEEKILQEGCIDDEKDMDLELNHLENIDVENLDIADLKFLDEIDQLIQEGENAKATTSNMGPILKSNDGDQSPLLYVPSCSKTSSDPAFAKHLFYPYAVSSKEWQLLHKQQQEKKQILEENKSKRQELQRINKEKKLEADILKKNKKLQEKEQKVTAKPKKQIINKKIETVVSMSIEEESDNEDTENFLTSEETVIKKDKIKHKLTLNQNLEKEFSIIEGPSAKKIKKEMIDNVEPEKQVVITKRGRLTAPVNRLNL